MDQGLPRPGHDGGRRRPAGPSLDHLRTQRRKLQTAHRPAAQAAGTGTSGQFCDAKQRRRAAAHGETAMTSNSQLNVVTRDRASDASTATSIPRTAAQRQRAYRLRRKRAVIDAIGEETCASRVTLLSLLSDGL